MRLQTEIQHIGHLRISCAEKRLDRRQHGILNRIEPGWRPAQHGSRTAQDQRGFADLDRTGGFDRRSRRQRREQPVQPPGGIGDVVRRQAVLEIVLGIEMRPVAQRHAGRMHNRGFAGAVHRAEFCHRRMQAEEAVEMDGLGGINGDRTAHRRISEIANRHTDVDPVHAATKHDNQKPRIARCRFRKARHAGP